MNPRDETRIVDLKAIIDRRRRAERAAASRQDDPPSPQADRAQKAWFVAGVALAIVVFFAAWIWQAGQAGRSLRRLPPAERAALYERTLATLRDVCEPAPPRSLRAFCRDQAAIVLELDECDVACREIARRNLTVPTR